MGVGDGAVAVQAETHRHAAPGEPFELGTLDDAPPARLDRLEHALHRLVCDGSMPLSQAQGMIARNWVAAYREFG